MLCLDALNHDQVAVLSTFSEYKLQRKLVLTKTNIVMAVFEKGDTAIAIFANQETLNGINFGSIHRATHLFYFNIMFDKTKYLEKCVSGIC